MHANVHACVHAYVHSGGILAGRKAVGIDPGGREERWDRSWRAGRMLGSILAGGKNAGMDPGGREECYFDDNISYH